ncbi:hypothetical protein BGZ60DRAFT_437353 [Tricladium varicosporioides]|nr:hypothetical protein BGZ60DRAFT_437353 [Hymenoscyphus varicosporioides]
MFFCWFRCWAALIILFLSNCCAATDFYVNITGKWYTGPNNTVWYDFAIAPNNTIAKVGDIVHFWWGPGSQNHSITQGVFEKPCVPAEEGFVFSAKTQNSSVTNSTPMYTYEVQDTAPIYFFDAKHKRCQYGMVGAINAPISGGNTVDKYRAAALLLSAPKTTTTLNIPQVVVTALLSTAALSFLMFAGCVIFIKRRHEKEKNLVFEQGKYTGDGAHGGRMQELEVREPPVELPTKRMDSPKFYELPGS